ncbi:membrane dipeptidase [Actinoplanes hulinensis]|uniref:Membrane dipeptidase n=1 Tax=Actinoplanes hulinensis TaxID=1144547 RepID=A0ABS7B928_9ACTN|nr:membrane dipeptidase [Actinoplanes hulinensis]MBW6436944.1 membrane dipeptidase [Actinoplanes hulinensis]
MREFYDLGVRTMLPAYNNRNAAGGGCLEETDEGLTGYGRACIQTWQAAGWTLRRVWWSGRRHQPEQTHSTRHDKAPGRHSRPAGVTAAASPSTDNGS